VEVHLLDFDGDLYGRKVQVEYLRFVRPEIKFPSVEDMRAQVMRDIEEAKRFFAAGEAEKETGE
jgi:riboflavin kinase/FMN adenylyltransferase